MSEKEIIVLQKNGRVQYVQTTVEAVAGLEEFSAIQDTGWQTLKAQNGYTWHTLYPGEYRIINNVIYLRGALTNSELAPNKVFAILPEEFAPSRLSAFHCRLMSSVASDVAYVDIGIKGEIRLVSATAAKNVYINQIYYPLK